MNMRERTECAAYPRASSCLRACARACVRGLNFAICKQLYPVPFVLLLEEQAEGEASEIGRQDQDASQRCLVALYRVCAFMHVAVERLCALARNSISLDTWTLVLFLPNTQENEQELEQELKKLRRQVGKPGW